MERTSGVDVSLALLMLAQGWSGTRIRSVVAFGLLSENRPTILAALLFLRLAKIMTYIGRRWSLDDGLASSCDDVLSTSLDACDRYVSVSSSIEKKLAGLPAYPLRISFSISVRTAELVLVTIRRPSRAGHRRTAKATSKRNSGSV